MNEERITVVNTRAYQCMWDGGKDGRSD